MEGYEHRLFDASEGSVHFLYRGGAAPPLVFVAGGALDSVMLTWKKVLQSVPAGHTVYALDLPGYGESGEAPEHVSTRYYSGIVKGFLLAHRISGAVLFGTSMSGAIALDLAPLSGRDPYGSTRPPLLRALVLSGAYGFQPNVPLHPATYLLSRRPGIGRMVRAPVRTRAGMRAGLKFVIADPTSITDELVDDAVREARRPRALEAFTRWLRHELTPTHVQSNFRPDLPRIDLPVLLLHGEHDWLMPIRYARDAAQLLPNAELHVFDTGHMIPREHPDEVNEVVHAFLTRI